MDESKTDFDPSDTKAIQARRKRFIDKIIQTLSAEGIIFEDLSNDLNGSHQHHMLECLVSGSRILPSNMIHKTTGRKFDLLHYTSQLGERALCHQREGKKIILFYESKVDGSNKDFTDLINYLMVQNNSLQQVASAAHEVLGNVAFRFFAFDDVLTTPRYIFTPGKHHQGERFSTNQELDEFIDSTAQGTILYLRNALSNQSSNSCLICNEEYDRGSPACYNKNKGKVEEKKKRNRYPSAMCSHCFCYICNFCSPTITHCPFCRMKYQENPDYHFLKNRQKEGEKFKHSPFDGLPLKSPFRKLILPHLKQ